MHYILFLLILIATPVLAQHSHDFKAQWHGKDSVHVEFQLCVPKMLATSNYSVFHAPYLSNPNAADTLRFEPVVFRGERNRRYAERARFFGDKAAPVGQEPALNDTILYELTLSVSEHPWLLRGRNAVAMQLEKEGCCETETFADAYVGHFAYIPPFVPYYSPVEDNTGKAGELQRTNPVLKHISEYRPYDESRVLRKEGDMLFVNFPLDKTTLLHDFRNNGPILDTIVSITRQIMADTTSSVRLFQIVGLASVEGSIKRNCALAEGRADVLKKYIQQRVAVPDSLFEVNNGCEGWSELRDQINDTEFEGQQELLDIIDNTPDPNQRERKMKRLMGGRPFQYIKKYILQDQRNSGYLRVYYDYVPDTAAAIINDALGLMDNNDYDAALKRLLLAKHDPRAFNALGICYYMLGREAEAAEYFERAALLGNPEAVKNLQQVKTIWQAREDNQ
jgi:outer membrane protein OmpA-like peptidoglycan-associated protein